MKKFLIHKKGFSLIELTIVVAITALMLPVFFQLIFNLTRAQVNISALQQVKQDGDFIRQTMINNIENNAYSIDPTCANVTISETVVTKMCFTDSSGASFGYAVTGSGSNYQIASYSATTTVLNSPTTARIPTRITGATFTQRNPYTVQFNYTVKHVPTVSYLASPTLTYDFFILTRRRN